MRFYGASAVTSNNGTFEVGVLAGVERLLEC
jgi:hypothetical protein